MLSLYIEHASMEVTSKQFLVWGKRRKLSERIQRDFRILLIQFNPWRWQLTLLTGNDYLVPASSQFLTHPEPPHQRSEFFIAGLWRIINDPLDIDQWNTGINDLNPIVEKFHCGACS